MVFTDTASENRVREAAAGLTKDEVLGLFGILDIEELTPADRDIFERAYLRGRSEAKFIAVRSVFNNMAGGRNSHDAAMAFLTRFAKEWPGDEVKEMSGQQAAAFVFNMVTQDDKKALK
jgi:hypothetical protein